MVSSSMPTFSEYLSQAQMGLMARVFGPEYIAKQTYLQQTDIFTETFGRMVWDALNNRTVLYNAIRKVGWGTSFGWRLRTDRGSGNSRPMKETGALPTLDVSNYVTVGAAPAIPSTTFGVSLKAQFMGGLEGGIGDALAVEQEAKQRDHIKEINQEITNGSYARVSAFASDVVTVTPASHARYFNIGDTVNLYDTGSTAYMTTDREVTARDDSAGTITLNGTPSATPAAGDIIFPVDRMGTFSISDVVFRDDEPVAGGLARPKLYNVAVGSRTVQHFQGASVDYNNGVGRDVSLKGVDDQIRLIRQRGGLMGQGLIWTGHDTYFNLERLFQAQQRFVGYETVTFGVGDETTYPGTQVSMDLATYLGIPILADVDCPTSVSSAGAELGSNLYVLDLDHLELGVAIPTQYVENRNYFAFSSGALAIQGLLFTFLQLRARRIDVHAVLGDLNT